MSENPLLKVDSVTELLQMSLEQALDISGTEALNIMTDDCAQLKDKVLEEHFECEKWLLLLSDNFESIVSLT